MGTVDFGDDDDYYYFEVLFFCFVYNFVFSKSIDSVSGAVYMKNMVSQHWEENDEAKPADPAPFVIHENDKKIIRNHIVEAIIASSSPIRLAKLHFAVGYI